MSDDPDKLKAKGAALWVELAQARAELSRLREHLEFSRAGNKTLTDIGASVARDLATERKETTHLRTALEWATALLRDYNPEREPWSLIEWESNVRMFLATPTTGGAPDDPARCPKCGCAMLPDGCVNCRPLNPAPDPEYIKECVCPFPRLTCPNCYNPCRACRLARAASPEKGTAACEICGGDGKKSESDPIYRGWSYCSCPAGQALARPLNPPCPTCGGEGVVAWSEEFPVADKPCPTCRPTPETPR